MYRTMVISAMTAAAVVGAGGTAVALTGSSAAATSGTGSSSTASASTAGHGGARHGGARHGGRAFRRLVHGQFVAKGPHGTFVTHDVIRGTVTAVSATSISVRAADNVTETFAVGATTKVRTRTAAKHTGGQRTASSIDKVATGDRVVVIGTGATTFTAKRIVDIK